ncbi:hypothetical protein DTO003C3_8842 [Penicillium roqueforti]|nr:hypothetical protein CBS147308_8588 [Penicillium roqueforti]KAI3281535.1 hypothetical protein DTO003C3_8842 [Penicillium roqueforti]
MELNEEFTLDTGTGRDEQDFPTFGNVQVALETPGLLDTLYFREKPTCDIALDVDEVEIEDYVIAMGNFESVKSSNESTGIISRVGEDVTHLQPGNKVICLERGYYDTFLRSPVQKCLKLENDADLVEMATVGIACGTAIYALDYLAHLEVNETVLIQAATGGLGLAAIQYAETISSVCGIPANHIFWSRTLEFKDEILKQARCRGIDVVLSTISGPGFHESLKCLAPCGRLIDVGRGNVLDKGNMGLNAFDRSISFFSFDLNFVLEEKLRIAERQESQTLFQGTFFDSMTLEQFNTAIRPKVNGAINLHNATINVNANLDFFMTSSTVTYVGHISQSNYAASNAVLDNLERQRISNDLPAATVSLGPIKGVGTLNRNPEYAENLLRSGLIEAEESEFIRHFNRFTHPQLKSKHFDSLTQGHILTGDRRSALLVTTLESRKAAGSSGGVIVDASGDDLLIPEISDDRDKAVIVLAEAVSQRLAKLMFISIEDIDISRPFSHFGLDSMSGSELIHWLSQNFGVGMSFLQLLAPSCSPKSLAGTIFDALEMKAAAAEISALVIVGGTSHESPNESLVSNGVNGSTGMNGSSGIDSGSAGSQMEKFSRSVRRAIADSKPVMHSYVCSVVNKKGEQLYTLSKGTLSQDSSTKVDFDAVYGMASLTKLMTTVAIMICVDRGQISLDDDIAPILPDLCAPPVLYGVGSEGRCLIKPRTKTITLRLLMSHQSGCGYHSNPPLARWARQNGKTNSVFDNDFEIMKTYPLLFEPGQGWMYGSGTDWAGEAIARMNNTTLEEFMRSNVWEPRSVVNTARLDKVPRHGARGRWIHTLQSQRR